MDGLKEGLPLPKHKRLNRLFKGAKKSLNRRQNRERDKTEEILKNFSIPIQPEVEERVERMKKETLGEQDQ